MQLLYPPEPSPIASAVAIGVFDGVHLGHVALLQAMQRQATAEGLRSVAASFDPHPVHVLRGPHSLALIEPVSRRLARFDALGIDASCLFAFSPAFARTTPQAYVEEVLCRGLGAKHVFVGENFTFGHRQAGNIATLQQLGAAADLQVHVVPLCRDIRGVICSSRVRAAIVAGDMPDVAACLGRPLMLEGTVVRGAGRGVGLGFGTANLAPLNQVVPAHGVYACRARGRFGTRAAVTNVGVAPTFGDQSRTRVEVHLLDYDGGELYGAGMEVEFVAFLRREKKFSGILELKGQLNLDVGVARGVLG